MAVKPTGPVKAASESDVASESKQADVNEGIKQRVFKEMGGIPKNFHKATVTPIGHKSYRVNIWTTEPAGEFGLFASAKMSLSRFLTVE